MSNIIPLRQAEEPPDGPNGMETRVTRLEVLAEHYDKRFDRIDAQLVEIRQDFKSLRANVWLAAVTTILAAWGVIIAVQSMTLDAIQAGKEIAAQPQPPIVIQMPATPQAEKQPSKNARQ